MSYANQILRTALPVLDERFVTSRAVAPFDLWLFYQVWALCDVSLSLSIHWNAMIVLTTDKQKLPLLNTSIVILQNVKRKPKKMQILTCQDEY